jgi:hypothetical protein
MIMATDKSFKNKNMFNKLKSKWGVQSNFQAISILLTFCLSGSSVVLLKKQLFVVLGYDETTAYWLKTVSYIVFILPTYQLLLLIFGSILGQFNFFWEKAKRIQKFITSKLVR